MPSASRVTKAPANPRYEPPFQSGDHMDQKTFHELYKQTPDGFKAELIGGVVYVASPVKHVSHGRPHARMAFWLGMYSAATEGTEVADNSTNILGEENEPQPDLTMIVLPESGGQTTINAEDYLVGPAELLVEVANTTAAIDRHAKRHEYEAAGVLEYLIVVVRNREVEWFTRGKRGFTALKPDAAGVLRSRVFPGLWLDPAGVFDRTAKRLLGVLNEGLLSEEHAKFVKKLVAKAKRNRS
ncbi:Uma2 family endonuclease [Limnoglobus roseus]|nr:Uma2 family endonuclease [Limnoglobus roseus]